MAMISSASIVSKFSVRYGEYGALAIYPRK